MTVNELIKALQKVKRKDKIVGDYEVIFIDCNDLENEIRDITFCSNYDECITIRG